jgi:dihydroorotate dehydrogenase
LGILSKEEARDQLKVGAHLLEVQVLSFFTKAGWNIFKRIEYLSS